MLSADVDDFISKEQTVLETYFYALGQFVYDKAKEIVERERDTHKTHQPVAVFSSFLTALSQLAVGEKNYTSLLFLVPKGFLRKDSSLKATYEALKTEFCRLEERGRSGLSPLPSPPTPTPSPTPTITSASSGAVGSQGSGSSGVWGLTSSTAPKQVQEVLEKLAGHLSMHLLHFVTARLDMMEFYERLYSTSSVRFIKYEDLVSSLSDIFNHTLKHFHHPLLSPLKSAFNFECEILLQLLEAQIKLQQWQFLPTLLHLHDAHAKLGAWVMTTPLPKEPRRLGGYTAMARQLSVPLLYQWLCRLKCMLVSKFTLYFHEVLSKQTSSQDMKILCSKNSVDLYHKILSFQRKSDALCVALVLETLGLEHYKGHGYHHPDKYYDTPKGLDSYPAIVSCPPEKPLSHWPNLVMIINDKARDLNNSDDVVSFYDKQVQTTYYLARIEPRMIAIAIFESKKSEANVVSFLQELCIQLRCNKVFAVLKPGSK